MGRVRVVPATGTVWENPTHGLPILNPIRRACLCFDGVLLGSQASRLCLYQIDVST